MFLENKNEELCVPSLFKKKLIVRDHGFCSFIEIQQTEDPNHETISMCPLKTMTVPYVAGKFLH